MSPQKAGREDIKEEERFKSTRAGTHVRCMHRWVKRSLKMDSWRYWKKSEAAGVMKAERREILKGRRF